MKKLSKWGRLRLIRRAEREAWARKRREYDGSIYGEGVRLRNLKFPSLPPRPYFVFPHQLKLQGDLDLVRDTPRSLSELTQLDRVPEVVGPMRVMIDLRALESIEPSALLFLCSRIAALGARPFVEVTGTYPPPESPAIHALRDAEFDSFLKGARIPFARGAKTLSLIDGTTPGNRLVNSDTASRINSFLGGLHPRLTTEELDALSLAVTECLENVRVHAYGPKEERRKGWYVVGRYDDASSASSVAILDTGVGIAATVAPKFLFGGRFKTPADLVEAATAGRVTASGAPNRGKGYAFLRGFVGKAEGRRLTVLSSSAMVTWGKGGILEKRATEPFTGTIVCLQITNS